MRMFFLTCLASVLFCISVFAQVISISGRITDEHSNKPIPGASVKVGSQGTSTDKLGDFYLIINQTVIKRYGVNVSCVGYESKKALYQDNGNYQISLKAALNTLHEINISANAESIIQKAIRKIPENYPDKAFIMEGYLRLHHIANDSAAYYKYYKNEAIIRMYYTSYQSKKQPEVVLLQNKMLNLTDKKQSDTVRWVNGYLSVPGWDFVHYRADMITTGKLHKYTYMLNGKGWINNNRVFVVNYYNNEKNTETGTLYIDTVNYAFVRGEITRYNVKRLGFVTIQKSNTVVTYKKLNGKWYFDHLKVYGTAGRGGVKLYSTREYQTTIVDTVKAEPLPYRDVIQGRSEDSRINKVGSAESWARYDTLFKKLETDTMIARIGVPVIDTVKPKFTLKQLPSVMVDYISKIKGIYEAYRLPLSISSDQPLLNKPVTNDANYGIVIGAQLPLYKQLYIGWDSGFNFGIGGLKISSDVYYLLYNLKFNKNYHPVTVSPLFGYYSLTLSQQKTEYYNQHSLVSGINLAYEVKHTLSFFVSARYYNVLDSKNTGISLNEQKLSGGVGFVFGIR